MCVDPGDALRRTLLTLVLVCELFCILLLQSIISPGSRLPLRQMSRDKTQKTTDNFPTPRAEQQVLTESPQNEHFEEDIFVPQSAPAWMGTFDLRAGSQKFQVAALTQTALEVRILCLSGCRLMYDLDGWYGSLNASRYGQSRSI